MVEVFRRIAVFGGAYSNHLALRETLRDATSRGAEAIFFLGDAGAFGPPPGQGLPAVAGIRRLLDAGELRHVAGPGAGRLLLRLR